MTHRPLGLTTITIITNWVEVQDQGDDHDKLLTGLTEYTQITMLTLTMPAYIAEEALMSILRETD